MVVDGTVVNVLLGVHGGGRYSGKCFVRCACMSVWWAGGGGGGGGRRGASYSSGDQTEWGMCKCLQCLLVLERVCLAILV